MLVDEYTKYRLKTSVSTADRVEYLQTYSHHVWLVSKVRVSVVIQTRHTISVPNENAKSQDTG